MKNLISELSSFLKKNNSLLDIIIFGSSVKGKEKPSDIDLLLIFKEKKDSDISYELKKLLEKKEISSDIQDITYESLFSEKFIAREAFLSEGYSIKTKKNVSTGLGYINFTLIKYDFAKLNKSQRMRFYYGLRGRAKEDIGLLDSLNAFKLSDNILLCPIENTEKMKEFFKYWKIPIMEVPILFPERITYLLKK